MASGTINGTTGNQYIDSKIVWSSEKNISANTSKVTAALYYKRNNTNYETYGTGSFTINIGGKSTSVTKYLTITENDWVLAIEATTTITHNADGSKSITISATGSIPNTSLSSTSCSGTVNLDTIPRAASIAAVSNRYLGEYCAVRWTPASKNFRYKLKFSMGNWSHTTSAIHPNKTTSYLYTGYILPLDAAKQIPNSISGTMTVTLYTFTNSGATEQAGEASAEFTVTVPDNVDTKPIVTSMTLAPISSLGSTFAGLYIQGYSKAKVTASAEGKYGASVVWKDITVEGKSYGSSTDYTSDYLSGYGTVYVKLSVRDSRGITNSKTLPITVIPYSKPRVVPVDGEASVACGRCDASGSWSDSGTYLKIKARRSYSLCMADGTQKNFCGLRFRYRKASESSFGSWNNILPNTATGTDEVITSPLLNGALSTKDSYVVQVDAVDSIPNHAYLTFEIPTEEVFLHKAGSIGSLGIGEYAESADTISIAKSKAVRIKSNINGVRMYNKAVSGTKELDISTKYADFTGNGNERQSFFVFGEANGVSVYGVARVANNGTTKWAGTEGVTLTTKSGGVLTVVLPAVAYDIFTILSGRDFTT